MSGEKYLKSLLIIISISFFILIVPFAYSSEIIKTPAEKVNYVQYSQIDDVALFLSELKHVSKEIVIQVIGQTREEKDFGKKDLYLCILTEEGVDNPLGLKREKPTLLLTASQHGNEQSGKEAALLFIRDLAVGNLKPLLKKANFLIIPTANPYGNWFDQRNNEQDLDLNRDHVKLESPEVESIHKVFRGWMPEITLDVHEKGDDYYRVSIGCVSNVNIHTTIQEYSRDVILSEVEKNLKEKGITFYEYLVTQQMGIDSSAGVRYRPEDRGKRETMKRYSTTDLNDGRNSLGVYETFSFIQECASRHDIQTLRERTNWQYCGIRFFAESIVRHGSELVTTVHSLRENLLERSKAYSNDDWVHLRMEFVRDDKEPALTVKKFEPIDSPIRGILKVDKKAGDTLSADDIAPYSYPTQVKVIEEVVSNWFPKVSPILSAVRPLGYVLPANHYEVVETMLRHGIKVDIFTQDIPLEIEAYQIRGVVPSEYDYLPPQKIDVEKKRLQIIVKKGDFYICCLQPGANLIPCLLEPESQYGVIRYWKFKLVPEPGDIFPFYRNTLIKDLPLTPYQSWKD